MIRYFLTCVAYRSWSVCVQYIADLLSEGYWARATLIKKKTKISSYIRKFIWERLQSHIWLTASSYMVKYLRILGSPSSYMTLQLLPCEFPNIYEENFFFFFISVASGSWILKFYSFPHIIQARPHSATPCEFFARLLLNEFTGAPSFPGCREHRGVLNNTVL